MTFSEDDQVLILGANSRIARTLLKKMETSYPDVTLVSKSAIDDLNLKPYSFVSLNLNEQKSVENFIMKIGEKKFDFIYIFIGAVSDLETTSSSLEEITKYYVAFAASLNFLISKLQNNLKSSSTLIFLSSRAAHRPSYDAHYSAVKASTEAFIKSIANKSHTKRFLILAPSLIEDTRIYEDMSPETIKAHRDRTSNSLLTLEEVAVIIFAMSFDRNTYLSGSTTCIGRDW